MLALAHQDGAPRVSVGTCGRVFMFEGWQHVDALGALMAFAVCVALNLAASAFSATSAGARLDSWLRSRKCWQWWERWQGHA